MLTIILLAILAGVVLYHLYNVLGTRGEEDATRQKEIQALFQTLAAGAEKAAGRSKGVAAPKGKGGAQTMQAEDLAAIWPAFDEEQFLQGAQRAFKQILDAYNAGEIRSAAAFLSPKVLKAFEASDPAEATTHPGERTTSLLEEILEAEIQDITVTGDRCRIVVLFVSAQQVQTRDAKGAPIPNTPDYSAEVQDLWVFEKSMKDKKTAWTLVATRNAA